MKTILYILFFISPVFAFSQSKPNIIFIFADDLGNGEIGSNVSDWSTPNIDSLRSKGAYFSRFYVQPSCTPSRVAFHSGQYPHRTGFGANVIRLYDDRAMLRGRPMIGDRLKEEGYYTGAIGKWHLGHMYPEVLPYNRGYDYEAVSYLGAPGYFPPYDNQTQWDMHENGYRYNMTEYLTEEFGSLCVNFITEQAKDTLQPFFLYVPFTAPHTPIEAPADTAALAPVGFNTQKSDKWAMVKIMDNEIGKIWQAVINAGIEENTIIIFTSDNGAELATGDANARDGGANDNVEGDNSPYTGEKTQLYDGGVRVPFIWYHKNTVSPGTVIDSLCGLVDMYPTFVDVAGSEPIAADSLDGQSIAPLLNYGGTWKVNRSYIIFLENQYHFAVAKGDYKLLNNPGKNTNQYPNTATTHVRRLYNIASDTREATDLYSTQTVVRDELQAIIDANLGKVVNANITYENIAPPGWWTGFQTWGVPFTFWNPNWFYLRN